MKHFLYARYLLRHKWFVLLECSKRGLVWRGLVHDMSKFLPSEWFAYVNRFFGPNSKNVRNKTGGYKPTDTGDKAFDMAWLHHQHFNKHHWQWWCTPEDGGGVKVYPMPEPYRTEMVCDWLGAGRAQGKPGVNAWYAQNGQSMQLHPDTRAWVEETLKSLP